MARPTATTQTRAASRPAAAKKSRSPRPHARAHGLPGQLVLVLQGGGALGAYQVGVYEAMHDAGLEPDWVIGTSIGAINAALIAGNAPADRMRRLAAFWSEVEVRRQGATIADPWGLAALFGPLTTMLQGIPSFFLPNPAAWRGSRSAVGIEHASYYRTTPLRATLARLVDFGALKSSPTRLTVGAVNACSGEMRYFDSARETIAADHVLASGALPPAFPAVRIDGEPYWDGGIYSNTPIEAVLDDMPRRDSLIFAVNVWHQMAPEPASIREVMGRVKDVQFASRADSHIARQKQLHRLRHVIRELAREVAPARQADAHVRELVHWGCGTTMHVCHLLAPRLDDEDQFKDIDFSADGLAARRAAGYADTERMIARRPWTEPADPIEGVVEHR